VYDLASDAAVTILVFIAMAWAPPRSESWLPVPPLALGLVAGFAIALIFFLRMRIETWPAKPEAASRAGRVRDRRCAVFAAPGHTQQCVMRFSRPRCVRPLFALWVVLDYRRALRQRTPRPRGKWLRLIQGATGSRAALLRPHRPVPIRR